MTDHHGIPQRLKPKHNVIIPICKDCHDKINSCDISGMFAYAFRLEQLSKQLRANAGKFYQQMNRYLNSEEKKHKV